MSWTPGTPLTSDPVDYLALEETSSKLWHEFLTGYFDGQTHQIGTENIIFPVAELNFQQSKMKQELDGVSIHIVSATGETKRWPGMRTNFNRAGWTFMVRARVKLTRPDNLNSEALARRTSDLLYALLESKAELGPLRKKGIHHIKASPGVPSESNDYRMRTLQVKARLLFSRE